MNFPGSRIDLNRLAWEGRQLAVRFGWQGVLGTALLLLSIVVIPVALWPAWIESKHIQAQAELLSGSVESHGGIQRTVSPATQLSGFYDFFPGTDSIADTLDRIYLAAAENSLLLNQADYSLLSAEGGMLQRYEVSMPLRGQYAQVRNFIAHALSENKNLALLGVSLTRNSAADAGVEAQVHFALYVRDVP